MTSDSYGIASAAIALLGWRWLAGMRWHVLRAPPLDDIAGYLVHPLPPGSHPYPGALPDLSDPATIGCLLALVREAWGDQTVYVRHAGRDGWRCHRSGGYALATFAPHEPTEPAALVAALLAAPPVTPRQ